LVRVARKHAAETGESQETGMSGSGSFSIRGQAKALRRACSPPGTGGEHPLPNADFKLTHYRIASFIALKLIFGNSDSGVDYTHQNHQSIPGASTAQRRDSKMQGLLRLIL